MREVVLNYLFLYMFINFLYYIKIIKKSNYANQFDKKMIHRYSVEYLNKNNKSFIELVWEYEEKSLTLQYKIKQ